MYGKLFVVIVQWLGVNFLTTVETLLDGKHCVFGAVTNGMEVLREIESIGSSSGRCFRFLILIHFAILVSYFLRNYKIDVPGGKNCRWTAFLKFSSAFLVGILALERTRGK